MKLILLFAIVVASFNSFAALSCGDDSMDKRYPHLSWEQVATYKINSPYITLTAIACAGVNYSNAKIERFHYRDTSGVKRGFNFDSLKLSDKVVISLSDFPTAARIVTRRSEPLTLKVISEKLKTGKRYYAMDFKFVRNMGMGFSSTDLRSFKVNAVVSRGSLGSIKVSTDKNIQFESVSLNVGGDLKVQTLVLSDSYKEVARFSALSLPRTRR
jgi:hypothetical protein